MKALFGVAVEMKMKLKRLKWIPSACDDPGIVLIRTDKYSPNRWTSSVSSPSSNSDTV
jgi:hypothetical protein